jgi:hypothetical protein
VDTFIIVNNMTAIDIYKKYPKIFPLMDDFFYAISSEIPDGWINLVDWLCGSIQSYTDNINNNNKHLPPVQQVICEQIKEKWGQLSFYYSGGDEQINGMVEIAEHISTKICIDCGTTENIIRTKGYITFTCKKCLNKRYKRNYYKLFKSKLRMFRNKILNLFE